MSYCCWLCDGFKSDIYCYENIGGFWSIHVAACKRRIALMPLSWVIRKPYWFWRYLAMSIGWISNRAGMMQLGLPHDGQDYEELTAGDCLARLLYLKGVGYHVPQHATDELCDEVRRMHSDT